MPLCNNKILNSTRISTSLVARLSGLAAETPVVLDEAPNREAPMPPRAAAPRAVPPPSMPLRAASPQPLSQRPAAPRPAKPVPTTTNPALVGTAKLPSSGAASVGSAAVKASHTAPDAPTQPFFPQPPRTLADTRISEPLIESLVLKYLLYQGTASGRATAEQACLPFVIIEKLLTRLKTEQLVVYRGTAAMGDYDYQLTERGCDTALRLLQSGSYMGSAPVHLDDYAASVRAQSISHHRPTMADIAAVFRDLWFDPALLNRIGQALDAGKGFFLYGKPGNGKTSIAQRVSGVFGEAIWIPRALGVGSDVIRLYDPCSHVELAPTEPAATNYDRRWVRIRRPAIIAGGELTMDRLEINFNSETNVNEAPLQLKSNCGTLVIDDFGRQRISPTELLNRWIVPLDRAVDDLHLPGGRTIEVPFDQLLVFATNLEPSDLVDEAFLRRIPYKLELTNPPEAEFITLLKLYAERFAIPFSQEAAEYLLERHYRPAGRTPRRCHARDLLAQIFHYCRFNRLPPAMTPANFDQAVENYFTTAGF